MDPMDATPETLLEHAAWVRRLARGLVADVHGAAELEQETWLAALTHAPRAGAGATWGRGWLARVAANLAHRSRRTRERVAEREERAARGEAQPSAAELVERADLTRALVAHLLALEEPYRSTLLLRYFEELSPSAIARREGRFVTLICFEIVEFDAYRQVFGSKAADSCQRTIGAQVTRVLRRAGDLCARYDECALVSAVLGQTPSEVSRLADQIVDNVRKLGLHNPRGKTGRYVTIRAALIACPPGTNDDLEQLIARARKDLRGKDTGPDAQAAQS